MKCNDPEGCNREEKCRGMCSKHYQRWLTANCDSKYKTPFSLARWNLWLAELNIGPNTQLRAGIIEFRSRCAQAERLWGELRDQQIAKEMQS